VKLLFDQNLSPRLVDLLSDLYPESAHVSSVGLDRAPDDGVWNHAKQYGFIVVTKDTDFHERSVIAGTPPKIIWIRRGNCSTTMIEQILRRHRKDIQQLAGDTNASYLVLI
jgi:predicted nuclease of predicted toxin-antitoxin system